MNFNGYYSKSRFGYINKDLLKLVNYSGNEKTAKTGSFYGKDLNFYIDTSDGVNDDLEIHEYCWRFLNIFIECEG